MQARAYRAPLGRFLSSDRYEQAFGDLSLQFDPLTQNRYAFAGGNPTSNVEFDGHFGGLGALVEGNGKSARRARKVLVREQHRIPLTHTAPTNMSGQGSGNASGGDGYRGPGTTIVDNAGREHHRGPQSAPMDGLTPHERMSSRCLDDSCFRIQVARGHSAAGEAVSCMYPR